MSKSLLTTKKIKKITKVQGNVIDLNYYLQYRKHKNNYNYWIKVADRNNVDEKTHYFLKRERLSAIESYNLAFCLN